MRRIVFALAVFCLLAVPLHAEGPTLEQRLAAFLGSDDAAERLRLAFEIAASEPDAGKVTAALPEAWSWDAEAVRGEIVTWERSTADGVAHTICALAPETYTSEKAWPLLLWLHGGVGRDQDGGGESGVRMFADEAAKKGFLILSPSTQNGAFWWEPNGMALVRGALADMKRRYRVDADRVCVAGFSDGASGCYHLALHDPEPYACFLAFMGNPLVSRSMGGPTWSASLGHRPIYGVNGGVDQLYPSEAMRPFFEEMQAGGLRLTWTDLPEVGHSPEFLAEGWEAAWDFWTKHPREPSPKEVAWCTSRPEGEGRNAWLEILAVAEDAPAAEGLAAPEELALPDTRQPRLGFRIDVEFEGPGIRIEDVEEGTPAADAGLEVGDVILKAGDVEIPSAQEIALLRDYLNSLDGEEGVFTIQRGDEELEIHAAPRILEKDRPARPAALGYDVPPGVARAKVLDGNVIEVETRGVTRIRLWFDTARVDPTATLTVKINGRTAYASTPQPSVPVLLAQAVVQGAGAPRYAGFVELDVRN